MTVLPRAVAAGFRGVVRLAPAARLSRTRDAVPVVHEDDLRIESGGELRLLVVGVADDDHMVARGTEPCGGAVELDRAAPPISLDDVGLETGAVVHVDDLDLLEGEDVGRVHEVAIERQAALVMEIGAGEDAAVDLGLAHRAAHGAVASRVCTCGGTATTRARRPA